MKKKQAATVMILVLSFASIFGLMLKAYSSECYCEIWGTGMQPILGIGDIVVVEEISNVSEIDVELDTGDIIAFYRPGDPALVVHRIISKSEANDTWFFATKGDNNPNPDPWLIHEEDIIGKVVAIQKKFEVGRWNGMNYSVPVDTNFSLSAFSFNETEKKLCFNITGTLSGEGVGFCNLTISTELLGGPYTLRIDNSTIQQDYNPLTNGTHAFLYFTYATSIHTVEVIGTTVIPEFPSYLIIPLFMIVTLLAAILYRRKHST